MELKTCRVYGDPHIQTFDGQKYDFMGRCNYILAVDCSAMNKWMVLGKRNGDHYFRGEGGNKSMWYYFAYKVD